MFGEPSSGRTAVDLRSHGPCRPARFKAPGSTEAGTLVVWPGLTDGQYKPCLDLMDRSLSE